MKIALIGYGKLNRQIEQAAKAKGHTIVTTFTSNSPLTEKAHTRLESVDICYEATNPTSAIRNIRLLTEMGKSVVVGTTGWYEHLPLVEKQVLSYNVGLLYAPNFSIGMLLFMEVIREAARLFNRVEHYDIGGWETHHNQKKDSPSGTAESLASIILQETARKNSIVYEALDRNIEPNELHFASLRCGSQPGTHTIYFDGPHDTIELTHRLRDRNSLAQGAIAAGEWLLDRKGFYSIQDMLADRSHCS